MDRDPGLEAAVDQFLTALAHGDMETIVQFMECPNCSAEYPDFHSPAGEIHTLCDNCGWSSEAEGPGV